MRATHHVLAALGASVALAWGGLWPEVHAGAVRQQARVTQQSSQPEVDPQSVPADARRSAREFWAKLPSDKKAALERELDLLEQRARRGDNVDEKLSQLRARYPELFQTAAVLKSSRWADGRVRRRDAGLMCAPGWSLLGATDASGASAS